MNKEEEGEEGPKKNIKLGRQVVGRTREEGEGRGEGSGWWIDRLKSKWGKERKERRKEKKKKRKGQRTTSSQKLVYLMCNDDGSSN